MRNSTVGVMLSRVPVSSNKHLHGHVEMKRSLSEKVVHEWSYNSQAIFFTKVLHTPVLTSQASTATIRQIDLENSSCLVTSLPKKTARIEVSNNTDWNVRLYNNDVWCNTMYTLYLN